MEAAEHEHHHVHFDEDEMDHDQEHNNDIVVKSASGSNSSDRIVEVHLGFLQVQHKYEVIVKLSKEHLPKSDNIAPVIPEVPNINCRYESNYSII